MCKDQSWRIPRRLFNIVKSCSKWSYSILYRLASLKRKSRNLLYNIIFAWNEGNCLQFSKRRQVVVWVIWLVTPYWFRMNRRSNAHAGLDERPLMRSRLLRIFKRGSGLYGWNDQEPCIGSVRENYQNKYYIYLSTNWSHEYLSNFKMKNSLFSMSLSLRWGNFIWKE
jgi:hypothetical protein